MDEASPASNPSVNPPRYARVFYRDGTTEDIPPTDEVDWLHSHGGLTWSMPKFDGGVAWFSWRGTILSPKTVCIPLELVARIETVGRGL